MTQDIVRGFAPGSAGSRLEVMSATQSSSQQGGTVPILSFEEGKRRGREELYAELTGLADAWDRLQLRAYASALRQAMAHIRKGEKFSAAKK